MPWPSPCAPSTRRPSASYENCAFGWPGGPSPSLSHCGGRGTSRRRCGVTIADLGAGALIAAFVTAICGLAAGVLGARRADDQLLGAARNAVFALGALLVLAAALLVAAFVGHDFS